MEEFKNENGTEQPTVEETVEQRPSTKYGRTAYQQQMQEEQPASERPYQQHQQNNWQEYNPQAQQYNAYTPYEEAKPEVKSWSAYVVMVLVALSTIVAFVVNMAASRAYSMGNTLEEIIDATLVISQEPLMLVLSTISDLLFWATVAFLVFDIIQLRKAGKKIGGAIAFAIFLRPAYFIWRAHLLGQKKVLPIIYTFAVYLISIVQYAVLLSASMEMVMRTMY